MESSSSQKFWSEKPPINFWRDSNWNFRLYYEVGIYVPRRRETNSDRKKNFDRKVNFDWNFLSEGLFREGKRWIPIGRWTLIGKWIQSKRYVPARKGLFLKWKRWSVIGTSSLNSVLGLPKSKEPVPWLGQEEPMRHRQRHKKQKVPVYLDRQGRRKECHASFTDPKPLAGTLTWWSNRKSFWLREGSWARALALWTVYGYRQSTQVERRSAGASTDNKWQVPTGQSDPAGVQGSYSG